MESNVLIQYLGNWQKWRKVFVLAHEYLAFKIFGSIQNTFHLAHKEQIPAKVLNREEWSENSKVPMANILIENGGAQNTQDQFFSSRAESNSSGFVQCHFDYELLETSNAISYTNETTHRSVFDSNGVRLEAHSSIRTSFPDISNLYVNPAIQVPGLTANLYGTIGMSNGNFGHWIFDGLSRAFLIQKHYSLNDFDHFLVPPRRYDFHHDSLEALGIHNDRIIELQTLAPLKFDRLVSTTAPRGFGSSIFPGHLIESYRKSFPNTVNKKDATRRLYISRRDASSRNFSNETEVIAALELEGFEEIQMSKFSFAEKIELFASAEFIVGLSGAGLTSLIFCQTHCKVLELFPDNELSYIYASIAGYLNLKYEPFLFQTDSSLNQVNRYYGEFSLDIDALLAAVRQS